MNSLYIFGFEGVIIDIRQAVTSALGNFAPEPTIPVDYFASDSYHINSISEMLNGLAPSISEMHHFEEALISEIKNNGKIYVGVKDGLKKLHNVNHRLAVLSNMPTSLITEILDHFELSQFFFEIVGSGGDYPIPPNPAAITTLSHEAEADDVWLIADNQPYLEMGNQADAHTVYAKYGYGFAEKSQYDAGILSFIDFEKLVHSHEV